jgi:hypothetical protein
MKNRVLFTALLAFAGAGFTAAQGTNSSASQSALARLSHPGPEHRRLGELTGKWGVTIHMGSGSGSSTANHTGTAESRLTTQGRFLFIEYAAKGATGPLEGTFTLGFDSRHDEFVLMATDTYGNYFVTSRGKSESSGAPIKMYGRDDDPTMKAMGLTKEFVHVLHLRNRTEFALEIWFVDTRTQERKEIKFMEYRFRRAER